MIDSDIAPVRSIKSVGLRSVLCAKLGLLEPYELVRPVAKIPMEALPGNRLKVSIKLY